MLASINGTDITKYIQESTYEVNQEDVYEEWLDGNYRTHREVTRTKVTGKFEMVFVTESEFSAFLTLLGNNTSASGVLAITLYVTNINTSASYNVFYEFENTSNRQINSNYFYKRFKMEIEER